MNSNNERDATAPQSGSRVGAGPTGRGLYGDPIPFLFQRPRRYCSQMMEQEVLRSGAPVMISLEADYAHLEARILAANLQAAAYLKR